MKFSGKIERHNFKCQLIEGALYLSSRPFVSPETVLPALIQRLGGSDIVIGSVPVIVYLAFFLPQLAGANLFSYIPYRRVVVLRGGLIQRLHLFVIAYIIGLMGLNYPDLTLFFFLFLYASNQATSGLITPMWGEFVAKTVSPSNRGKLLGLRTSLGAVLGFINGFLIILIIGNFLFPWSYATLFLLAGILQMSSLVAQKYVIESEPSNAIRVVSTKRLMFHVLLILRKNNGFRKFLFASTFVVIGFMSVAFFTVAALRKFALNESYVGTFTIITIIAQVLSSATLGWLADKKGTKSALLICAAALFMAILLAFVGNSVFVFYIVFFLTGVNLGAETFLRYNIAVEFAPTDQRALYVGVMNAWLAPFYLFNLIGGWISTYYGYTTVFSISLFFILIGIILLFKVPYKKK